MSPALEVLGPESTGRDISWSGQGDSNPCSIAWKAKDTPRACPLNYLRAVVRFGKQTFKNDEVCSHGYVQRH